VTGRIDGKVALITGAARGQGRSHAIRLAAEGADIIAVDACADYASVPYAMATPADLAETADAVRNLGRRIVTRQADVRDLAALTAAVDAGVAELGRLDIVCANAGLCTVQAFDEVTPELWRDTIDTNLTGVWHTLRASAPHLIAAGGGSVICVSSTAGLRGLPFFGPYSASKFGVTGIAKSMANELAEYGIRVNTVHPTGVSGPMADGLGALPPLIEKHPATGATFVNAIADNVEPADVTNAVLFLASDEARYVTGLEFTIDAGMLLR